MSASAPPTVDMADEAIDAALALAAQGFRVLPIKPGEKYPPMSSWQHAASSQERTVRNWFTGMYRGHGVGIATGGDFFVLDVDDNDKHSGSDTLAKLERDHGALPMTITSITGSGGRHLLFKVPDGYPCPQNNQSGKVGDGLDIRGGGGQIVCAPTIHPNGRPYAWEHAPGDVDMAVAPDWLMELLAVPQAPVPSPPTSGAVSLRELVSGPYNGDGPAARFDARTTWPQLLDADGWTLDSTLSNGEQRWTRPGKDGGTSATVGHKGIDCLKVFTSSVPGLTADKAYGRFGYMAARLYAGDESAAAHALLEKEGRARKTVDLSTFVTNDETAATADIEPFPTRTIGEMARAVDAMPSPTFLVRRLIVAGDYGVLGAERKFGKTFTMADLAVNVAAGGRFLGTYECDTPGAVLLFAGEGGTRKIVRRTRAVAAWYGLPHDELPLHVYERAPKLADIDQVARLRATVEMVGPVLVIIDPAYLALSGAETSSLTSMGTLLERAQFVAQDAGAALFLSHHWNKTGLGSGVDRFTGAGFAEWARMLISGSTKSINTDRHTQATTAIAKLEVMGDEIAGSDITFRRVVWVEDLDDLASPMHYECTVIESDEPEPDDAIPDTITGAARRVLDVLTGTRRDMDWYAIGNVLAPEGHPLKKRTILDAAKKLEKEGLISRRSGSGNDRDLFRAHLALDNDL